jgi:hypothetical protein
VVVALFLGFRYNKKKCVCIIFLLLGGMLLYALIMGNIATAIATSNAATSRYK